MIQHIYWHEFKFVLVALEEEFLFNSPNVVTCKKFLWWFNSMQWWTCGRYSWRMVNWNSSAQSLRMVGLW